MKIVVDANILVSSILGRRNRFGDLLRNGAVLMIAEAQVVEASRVVSHITGISGSEGRARVAEAIDEFVVIVMNEIVAAETSARHRLGERGQPDWPVLATAITFDAHIWSNDRDFFGVGLPVWSMRNIAYAIPQGAPHA